MQDGQFALYWAAKYGHRAVVHELLKREDIRVNATAKVSERFALFCVLVFVWTPGAASITYVLAPPGRDCMRNTK